MQVKGRLNKSLAIVGSLLVWLPIVIPVLLALIAFFQRGRFLLDYLMPAELFPVVLIGGALLLWAAIRIRKRRSWILFGLGAAIGLLFLSQGLAIITGLASGETEPSGWPWALVLSGLAGYTLAVCAVGAGGILLLRDLWRAPV